MSYGPEGHEGAVPLTRLFPVRTTLAVLSVAVLLAGPMLFLRSPDALDRASVASTGGVGAAPFLALAILGAMSCLVLLVAFRPAK